MKSKLKMIIPVIGAVVLCLGIMPARAHLFWAETDADSIGSLSREVRIFLGHPDMPDTNIVPEVKTACLHSPGGGIAALALQKERDHQKATVRLDQKGVYVVTAAREPGIFDPKWHNHEGPARLTKDFAKLIMVNGPVPGNPNLDAALDLEIVPVALPRGLKTGDVFKAVVQYKGKPVKGEYSAAQATANMHDPKAIQTGVAGRDGTFSVDLHKEGMWVVMVEYGVDESGIWQASHDLVYKGRTYYKKGEKLPYGTVKCRSTFTFYVKGE